MAFATWLRRQSVLLSVIFFSVFSATLYARCFSARSSPPVDEAPASARLRRDVLSSPASSGLEIPESDPFVNSSTHLIAQRQTASTGDVTYYCSVDEPCSNGACCGQSGICGYGPTYCSTGCTSNCDAHAPCGQYSESGSATCPLNVCCSQFGFCGTTSDFCGVGCQSNCGTPSSPGSGGDVRQSVIGYYESWRAGSQCSWADPSQIPAEGLTGLNFAFVYVLPDTYDIVPMDGVDSDLFARVTDAKVRNPDLTVSVSVGGWDFSDDGTATQPVFGDIASSLLKRATFARKLYQFMVQYGFDGVDLDWEYPGAPDRGGIPDDVGNYPLLLQMIRFIWQLEGKSFRLSVTAPTSYWYLRWFDLSGIAQYVDYINLMAYDLHGVWDSTDPIGPFVYAHTNLTEIDAALSLFWRNYISPSLINLGLAFYGRTFTLLDPSCTSPGCPFVGPGLAGECSATPGILAYNEIESLLSQNYGVFPSIYDAEAAVNYAIYDGGTYWVSYDDSVTFQQKVDYANSQGLHGLFIWAVDMDDGVFSALKAVTGQQDLTPAVPESNTLGNWNVNNCYTTQCGWDCDAGWVKMTGLNLDANGNGCSNSGRNSQQRSFCCPPWGVPDPDTCTWRGSGPQCYGQCVPGEVLMTVDNYGGSAHCDHGVKVFCCPASSGNAAEAACRAVSGDCPPDVPQKIGSISGSRWASDSYCCPAAPVWENCAWHGDRITCENNRCPAGQIEMATDSDGPGLLFGCVLHRQMAFCCDPPFGGTAFVPVPLEDLFPETLPAGDAPVYYEAFDHTPNETPRYDSSTTDDPNQEPFAWTIMVGASADVQTLRRRDGSHLETFDCPNPDPSDYGIQKLKAVCMVNGDDHNCEDILIGGARGTVVRLPEECGPDEWVRVVSFRQLNEEDTVEDSLPAHLARRAPPHRRIYEIRYDYNFRLLRRDGGEVYVRFDASTHPGYWGTIVSSSPNDTIVIRTPEEDEAKDWRAFHTAWFERHRLAKRGFGTTDNWWLDRFNILLSGESGGSNYGLTQSWSWSQVLYSAEKNCPPSATAYVEAVILGELTARLDYGISLIGTLRNFDFSESYAFFALNDLILSTKAELNGNAGFAFQSQTLPLLDPWTPFGGSFNIKGLWTIGPYIEVTAQIQALATVSGEVSAGMQMSVPVGGYTYMFPQSLNEFPSGDNLDFWPLLTVVTPGQSATITTAGSFTITATPAIGFQIQLDAFGVQLVNTKAIASFTNAFTLQVGANSPDCDGVQYELLYGIQANVDLIDPLPGWSSGSQHINVYSRTGDVRPMECYAWSSGTPARRSPATLGAGHNLTARTPPTFNPINSGALFPDLLGSLLSCPNDINTPTGDCFVDISDSGSDQTDGGAISAKRDLDLAVSAIEDPIIHTLEKRDKPKVATICKGSPRPIEYKSRPYPTSGEFIGTASIYPFSTYGPLNPSDCNDYSFGLVPTPPSTDSRNWHVEHVLEWQLLTHFWHGFAKANDPTIFADPVTPSYKPVIFGGISEYTICPYLSFWWDSKIFNIESFDGVPTNILASAFPGGTGPYRSEFTLIEAQTNHLKLGIWGLKAIRKPDVMSGFVNGDVNRAINMQIPEIAAILATQATRIGTYMDNIEAELATFNDPSFNQLPYETLGLGNLWRKWIYDQHASANAKYTTFMEIWVTAIQEAHASDQNPAIVTRVAALVAAYNNMPEWINPFPAAWA